MRLLIYLALLVVLSIALFRSSPKHASVDARLNLADAQPAAIELDDLLPLQPEPSDRNVIPPPGIALPELHEQNDQRFRDAPGFGYTRRGRHVLLSDNVVHFIDEPEMVQSSSAADPAGGEGPYGLWGKLGAVNFNASTQSPAAIDHPFRRLSDQQLKDHDPGSWRAVLIQLVSVDHRWAYDDDELPSMETIADKSIGTRPLDAFELSSVAKLRGGEHVVIQRTVDRINMVGAIRAGTECLSCHSANEGDLLGAFTYRFEPTN